MTAPSFYSNRHVANTEPIITSLRFYSFLQSSPVKSHIITALVVDEMNTYRVPGPNQSCRQPSAKNSMCRAALTYLYIYEYPMCVRLGRAVNNESVTSLARRPSISYFHCSGLVIMTPRGKNTLAFLRASISPPSISICVCQSTTLLGA